MSRTWSGFDRISSAYRFDDFALNDHLSYPSDYARLEEPCLRRKPFFPRRSPRRPTRFDFLADDRPDDRPDDRRREKRLHANENSLEI